MTGSTESTPTSPSNEQVQKSKHWKRGRFFFLSNAINRNVTRWLFLSLFFLCFVWRDPSLRCLSPVHSARPHAHTHIHSFIPRSSSAERGLHRGLRNPANAVRFTILGLHRGGPLSSPSTAYMPAPKNQNRIRARSGAQRRRAQRRRAGAAGWNSIFYFLWPAYKPGGGHGAP